MKTFILDHPIFFIAGALGWMITCLYISYRFYRKYIGLKMAERMIKEDEFSNQLSQPVIDQAIEDAEKKGNKKEFLAELVKVRQKYGHDGVKVGHLFWIWSKLNGELKNSENIPDFQKKTKTSPKKNSNRLSPLVKKLYYFAMGSSLAFLGCLFIWKMQDSVIPWIIFVIMLAALIVAILAERSDKREEENREKESKCN